VERLRVADLYGDFSDFYDVYVGDWLADVPFYQDFARSLETPILELGAGSGRLTLPLAEAGHSVVAVDVSPSMLARLRSRLDDSTQDIKERIQVVEADLCELDLATAFDLILVPFYTFNYLLTPQSQRQALKRIARHLIPNGNALIDLFLPLKHIRQCPSEPIMKVDRVDEATGNRIRGWNQYVMDIERQIETRIHRFEITAPNGEVYEREFTTRRRYFFPQELEALFAAADLKVKAIYSGYQRKPVAPDSEQRVYVLERVPYF
jgi:SAM-dependent methyltransferase